MTITQSIIETVAEAYGMTPRAVIHGAMRRNSEARQCAYAICREIGLNSAEFRNLTGKDLSPRFRLKHARKLKESEAYREIFTWIVLEIKVKFE